jgi:hypothetical protein
VRDREHLLVANEPKDFAGAVRRLLGDPHLRTRLGRAARDFAVSSVSLQAVRSSLRDAVFCLPR